MADQARIVADKILQFNKEITLQFHKDVLNGKMSEENKTIAYRTKKIIGEHLGFKAEELKEDQEMAAELGMDDIDVVEITMALEEEFDIELTDVEMIDASTVEKVINLVQKEINKK